jgi:hypothetical protein
MDSSFFRDYPIHLNKEVIEMPNKKFDPEGEGYDYETAQKHGITQDSTGHWPSREPNTGQILKGAKHKTYHKTVEGEKKAGYDIQKEKDGRYYSRKQKKENSMKHAMNVEKIAGQDFGSKGRDVGTGNIGLYKRPKKKKQMDYTRKAPNYHANTDTDVGSETGGGSY